MITALKNIINDPARIIESTQISDTHLTDGLKHHTGKADVVVLPISTDEVSQIMKYAHQHNIVVTPRGAGAVSREYLALPDGPGRFTQDFSCPALLRIPLGDIWLHVRDYHPL